MLALSGKTLFPLFSITSKRIFYLGQFGTTATINIVCILAMFLLFMSKYKFINRKNTSLLSFFVILIILSLYSYFNPYNVIRSSFIPPLIYFLQILFFLYAIKVTFSDKEIFNSLYSAISIWVCFQLLLTICYPILNIQSVLTLFHEGSEFWAERREGYHSATGTFIHPAGLAYTISLYVLFYVASYFSSYRKLESLIYIIIGLFIIVLTYSRSSYIALFISISILLFTIFTTPQKTAWNIVVWIIGFIFIAFLLINISFFSDLFLKSDSASMVEGRAIHLLMGWNLFQDYPILGTGINNHVYHLYNNLNMTAIYGEEIEFIIRSPIHNLHMIVLVETGVIGFSCWLLGILYILRVLYKSVYLFQRKRVMCSAIVLSIIIFSIVYGFGGWSIFNYEVLTPLLVICMLTWNSSALVRYSTYNIS